jgi:subtilase family serine protease
MLDNDLNLEITSFCLLLDKIKNIADLKHITTLEIHISTLQHGVDNITVTGVCSSVKIAFSSNIENINCEKFHICTKGTVMHMINSIISKYKNGISDKFNINVSESGEQGKILIEQPFHITNLIFV